MLVPALLALSISQRSAVPYRLVMKTEAKSPHSETATLIQEKRKAFDFLMLVKEGALMPRSIRKVNWRKDNVLVIYPGLVQRDAKITLKRVRRFGHTIQVLIDSHRGMSAESYYPIFVVTIPKQALGIQTQVLDPNRQSVGFMRRRSARP